MIVCLSGYKGSGKDMLADDLTKNGWFTRVALADPLKDSVAAEYGIDRTLLDNPKLKESPLLNLPVDPKDGFSLMIARFMVKEFRCSKGEQPLVFNEKNNKGDFSTEDGSPDYRTVYHTPRSLAILKGSVNRSVRSNYWTGKAFEEIEKHLKVERNVVITDIRYKSEIVQFKQKFGDQVKFIRINRFKECLSQDPSERDLDDHEFDFYIENTGTKDFAIHQLINTIQFPLYGHLRSNSNSETR
jgi:hypothetical protein